MKETTLHSLITSRALFEEAKGLCLSQDRHLASAGVVVLQDALELVFFSLLIEKGVDEVKNLESKGFDELIGELKKSGIRIPKTGILKALNKQRVITKHYSQMAEPSTVKGYVEAAEIALEDILKQVVGKSLYDIFLTDLLNAGEAREFLEQAVKLVEQAKYLETLTEVRKALYVEIEKDYSIYEWKDDERTGFLSLLAFGNTGSKAPSHTRNKKWISAHVKDPLDYIQIDYEQLRLDAMEWGVNTAELESLRRLTPSLFRASKGSLWHIKYNIDLPSNEANRENAKYCLDRTIAIILKKQEHQRTQRYPKREPRIDSPAIYIGETVYSRASTDSDVVHIIKEGDEYMIHAIVTGFNNSQKFSDVFGTKEGSFEDPQLDNYFSGYLLFKEVS